MIIRQLNVDDAQALHGLYQQTPQYFRVISMPMPNLMDVQAELETGLSDPRRELCFLYADLGDGGRSGDVPDGNAGSTTQASPRLVKDDASRLLTVPAMVDAEPIGYLDLKLDYPNALDATINLLLISERSQSQRFGSQAISWLEAHLRERGCRRVLASVYGHNPRAVKFWERLGYRFAVDARPVLEWYAKALLPGPPGKARPATLALSPT